MGSVQNFKGLSLNGGGIRGLLTTVALQAFQNEKWDVIAGTSTGSIIAGLLAFGYKPNEITKLYNQLAAAAFKSLDSFQELPRPNTQLTTSRMNYSKCLVMYVWEI